MRPAARHLVIPFALALAAPALAAEQAGVSAAVRGQVALNRQQVVVGRQVVGGEPILLQDGIQSGQRSGMQLLLLDETVFTIGPESEIVIDEFVYDPKTNAGKLSAEITKGVFRFVSGKIAHEKPEDMNVKLPSGTLGVRGTMVAGRVDPTSKSSRLVLLGEGPENDTGSPAGAFIACNAGECVRINRPGYGTTIDGPDAPPVTPFLFSRDELDSITGAVSDPEGWVEQAEAEADEAPDVATGPEDDEAGAEGDDPRSASEVSGISDAAGAHDADEALEMQFESDVAEEAVADAAEFSDQSVEINGREVDLPEDCTDLADCIAESDILIPTLPADADITSFDELSTLATQGLQQAVYQQANLGLVDGLTGQADGSYDFSLIVSFGSQTADLSFSNINSSQFGLSGESISQQTDFSSFPPGFDLPATFGASAEISSSAACAAGCSAAGIAQLSNGNGRIADSALQFLGITAPDTGSGTLTGSFSAAPFAPVQRPPDP